MSGPKFDLSEVHRLVNDWKAGKETGWFSATSASIDYVAFVFSCRDTEAEKIVLEAILKLEPSDFSRRILQWDVDVADLYGLEGFLGYDWYIKFLIDDGVLE